MRAEPNSPIAVRLSLARAISRAGTMDEIYGAALASLEEGLGVSRVAIVLFDPNGTARVKAARGLSAEYLRASEGFCPWTRHTEEPPPLVVPDVTREPLLATLLPAMADEHITALAFIPLVEMGRVDGTIILYDLHNAAGGPLPPDALQLASVIAADVAFAGAHTRTEEAARRSEERLRFALDAASMGTWDWDLVTQRVRWSENLERLHGLPPGTFDGTFASYEREIHPADRERVLASVERAIKEGTPHDVEYRIVTPNGVVQWVEGKGRVEYEHGRPARMTGVCLLVTKRKEAELARLASAEEANQLKDEFLATLSHELRTPLNAILGWTQMLQSDGLPPERIRPAIDVISRNARLQAQLIEDILDVSRIIRGKLDIERRRVYLAPVIDTVLSGLIPSAAARQIQVTREVPDDLPPVDGDPKRLQQILGNIVSNAIKFTPDGGHVSVRCAADAGTMEIQVRDSGVGITPDLLPFVFDRFRQGDSRSTRRHGGLGLGLAIARHLVEQHDGTIRAESEGRGRGTTFRITLPTSPHGAADEELLRGVAPADLELAGVTVLVVDDQPDARELLEALFDRCDANVLSCASAAEALETIRSTPIDLMVADIAMPHVDGYELIARVRRLGGARGAVPAVAVSAYARLEDRTRALAAGYNAYCSKPIDAPELIRVIGDVLAESRQSAGESAGGSRGSL
jgi:PAS domain S-box-containing protein